MTANLPATFIEAEAENFARHWFTNLGQAAFLDTGHTFLDPAAAQAFVRQMIKAYAVAHPSNAAKIVEYANHGWDEARAALRELITERSEKNEPLGAVLGAYNIHAWHSDGLRCHQGRSKVPNLLQDIAIAMCVLQLIERFPGLKLRRRQNKRASAYSIIAKVTSDLHLHRGGEEAIRKICERYLPVLLNGYRWPDWGRGSSI